MNNRKERFKEHGADRVIEQFVDATIAAVTGRPVRQAGGVEPIPQGRPAPGHSYVVSSDGTVRVERDI